MLCLDLVVPSYIALMNFTLIYLQVQKKRGRSSPRQKRKRLVSRAVSNVHSSLMKTEFTHPRNEMKVREIHLTGLVKVGTPHASCQGCHAPVQHRQCQDDAAGLPPFSISNPESCQHLGKGYSECMFERSAPLLVQLPLSPWEMLYHIQTLQFRTIKNMKINMIL